MLFILQVWGQSLEAIPFIVAKSAGRISDSCMHVSMQIQTRSVTCTLQLFHRPTPTCPHYSSLCCQGMGARITQPTPLISHSNSLDNSESNSSQFATAACFFVVFTKQPAIFLTFCPPVDLLRNQIVGGAVPIRPDPMLHLRRLVTLSVAVFVTLYW